MRKHVALILAGLVFLLFSWHAWDHSQGKKGTTLLPEPQPSGQKDVEARRVLHPSAGNVAAKNPEDDSFRGDAPAVDRLISSIDWVGYCRALSAYSRLEDAARRKGSSPSFDRETIDTLAQANAALEQVSQMLGVEDPAEILFHERVAPRFERGRMEAMGINLSREQEEELDRLVRAFSRSRIEEAKAVAKANDLERLTWEAEREIRWDSELQGLLPPSQFELYAKAAGPDRLSRPKVPSQEVQAGSLDGTVQQVEGFWKGSFGLDETSRVLLEDTARRYVQEYHRRLLVFEARFPADPPREEFARFQIGLVRLQIAAERELRDKLQLAPDQQDLVADGSRTILRLRWK